jgi:hypothetical protein
MKISTLSQAISCIAGEFYNYLMTIWGNLIRDRTAEGQLKIPPTTSQDIYVPISQEEEILCKYV